MSVRLQEVHSALVHLSIALLPLKVGANMIGSVIDNKLAPSFAQKAICMAAAAAVGFAVTGLIACEEVDVEGASQDMLITPRDPNFIAPVVATSMALWRVKHRKPSAAYLGDGAPGVVILTYTIYLGGNLVYDAGVGVEPARSVYRSDAPKLESGQAGSFVLTAGTNLVHGVHPMAQKVANGRVVPTIMASLRKQPLVPAPATGTSA